MPGYKVCVLCDSVSPDGVRLVSIAYQAPRVVLAELNTHRIFSRNAESSRAIPFTKKLKDVIEDPYVPGDLPGYPFMGENPGMQATTPMADGDKSFGRAEYIAAANSAARSAEKIAGYRWHKQDVNRIIEPYGWTRGVVSSTEWANFFALRCGNLVFPPFGFLARAIYVAMSRSTPSKLDWNQWHLPFITPEDREEARRRAEAGVNPDGVQRYDWISAADTIAARWSAARCARVSYYHFGRRAVDYTKDDDTYAKLAGSYPLHASPLEHPACCIDPLRIGPGGYPRSNFRSPWVQLRKMVAGENILEFRPPESEVDSWEIPDEVFAGEPSSW